MIIQRVRLPARRVGQGHPVLTAATQQLGEYFSGTRRSFDLPLDPQGTPFQREVWTALASIPFGETRSYGEIAAQIGRPSASRAVGAANGRNPLSIIVPCHRVIGKAGGLTGLPGVWRPRPGCCHSNADKGRGRSRKVRTASGCNVLQPQAGQMPATAHGKTKQWRTHDDEDENWMIVV